MNIIYKSIWSIIAGYYCIASSKSIISWAVKININYFIHYWKILGL